MQQVRGSILTIGEAADQAVLIKNIITGKLSVKTVHKNSLTSEGRSRAVFRIRNQMGQRIRIRAPNPRRQIMSQKGKNEEKEFSVGQGLVLTHLEYYDVPALYGLSYGVDD